MRLWLNRSGEIPLREQLVTQVRLSVLCRELAPGQRLPSTRELARRFGIHANTASAAYRELEREGWLEFRHGSGVYVRATRPDRPLTPELIVDQMVGELAAKARRVGVSESLIKDRLRQWLSLAPPARWMVIEPDPELRRIVLCELEGALGLPVSACGPEACGEAGFFDGSMPACLPSKLVSVRKLLPAGMEPTVLEVHPVAAELEDHLKRYLPAHAGDLIGVASRWEQFQRVGNTMLIAAGLAPENLLVRDATKPGWRRGLEATSAVVCDVVTAQDLPPGCHALQFRLFGDPALDKLRVVEARVSGAQGEVRRGL